MNFPKKNEGGFISFFALIALMILSILGTGLFLIANENVKMERHHELAVELRYDAESVVEKIAYDIENKNIILPDDIKEIDEYVIPNEYILNFGNNKKSKVSVKYESNGIRILGVVEKTDENIPIFGVAEGFLEDNEGEYKWKYWIKVR